MTLYIQPAVACSVCKMAQLAGERPPCSEAPNNATGGTPQCDAHVRCYAPKQPGAAEPKSATYSISGLLWYGPPIQPQPPA